MIEFLSGVGALGISYHSCPYWRRRKGTPSIHISLWFVKLLIQLPFSHITPKGHGTATSSYGVFWWPAVNKNPRLFWSTLTNEAAL
jgi:hypothetical protein